MRLYTIHTEYLAYLHTIDTRVPLQHKKSVNRPYAGILLTEDNFNYFIPLSSPKEKFKTMKNTRDFIKIDYNLKFYYNTKKSSTKNITSFESPIIQNKISILL